MSEKNQAGYNFNTTPNEDEFTDPVLRCDSCQALVKRVTLHRSGACHKCGNKRMRALTVFNDVEKAQMEEWGFQDFVNDGWEELPDE